MCIHSLTKFNLLITIYPYSYLHEIIGLDDFLQRNENRWVTTKDYYITGRANLISCAVGLR